MKVKSEEILKKFKELEERVNKLESANNKTSAYQGGSVDPLYDQAVVIISDYDRVSASLLQRRLSLGYARACRMLDQMEANGLVGPAEGSKPRERIKEPKTIKQNGAFLSLLAESYDDGIIPYKWLLKMYDSSKLDYKLPMILGISDTGKVQFADICKTPHMLIGGGTGSGKTIFLYSLISTLLYYKNPEELRFIFIDFKRVDYPHIFKDLPHSLTEIIVDPDKAISALKWTVGDMENRYKKLAEAGVRNIEEYNKIKGVEKLPYIIFIIDELADLMIFSPKETEELIIHIAQMARATGIHLILSTQRPCDDVFTGMMRANIPTRLAFSVASSDDSKVILDMAGAEKLRGKGDMLFLPPDEAKPTRIQSPFITPDEISAIVQYITKSNKYIEKEYKEENEEVKPKKIFKGKKDKLLSQARAIIQQQDKASASLIQRRLSIGYARAASILDQLEAEGIVGPAKGSKPRVVIKTKL